MTSDFGADLFDPDQSPDHPQSGRADQTRKAEQDDESLDTGLTDADSADREDSDSDDSAAKKTSKKKTRAKKSTTKKAAKKKVAKKKTTKKKASAKKTTRKKAAADDADELEPVVDASTEESAETEPPAAAEAHVEDASHEESELDTSEEQPEAEAGEPQPESNDDRRETDEDSDDVPDGERRRKRRRRRRRRGERGDAEDRDRETDPREDAEDESADDRETEDRDSGRRSGGGRDSGDRDSGSRSSSRRRKRGREVRLSQPAPTPDAEVHGQRIALLIDLERTLQGAKAHPGELSFARLLRAVGRRRHLVRAFAYADDDTMRATLEANGIEVRTAAEAKTRTVAMAVDAMAVAGRVDAIVVLPATEGLDPLTHALDGQGVRVESADFEGDRPDDGRFSMHHHLGAECTFTP